MSKYLKTVLFILLIILSDSKIIISADSLAGILPDAPKGWIKSETLKIYNRQNLFDYIDGGAEVYLAYDFQKLIVQEYSPALKDSLQEKSITVEIWQMKSSADAYGVFSLDQEGEKIKIGQMGVYYDGLLRFWKDVFFVSILMPEGDYKDVIFKLGDQINRKIQKEGKLPQLVSIIPSDSLIPGSAYYFHKQITLNNLYNFSDQSILNLSVETNCALADYKLGNDSLKLLLIQYPDTIMATRAKTNMRSVYLEKGTPAESKIFKTGDGKLIGMDVASNYLIIIFEGKNEHNISRLLGRVKSSLDQSLQLEKL
jgi:hypothetical protein